MKKLSYLFLAILIGLASCSTPEPEQPQDDGSNTGGGTNTQDESILWSLNSDNFGAATSDMAVDENDNIYFISENNGTKLNAVDKNGHLLWSKDIDLGTFAMAYISIAQGSIVIRTNTKLMVTGMDGTYKWEQGFINTIEDVAVYDDAVYIVLTDIMENLSTVMSFSLSDGSENWSLNLNEMYYCRLSASNGKVAVTGEDRRDYPYYYTLQMLEDLGSSVQILWSESYQGTSSMYFKAYNASFGPGNKVYVEESASGTTYLHAYDTDNGNELWNTKLADANLSGYGILVSQSGTIYAYYSDSDDWGITNSVAVVNATDGTIIAKHDNVIIEEDAKFLTSSNSVFVINHTGTNTLYGVQVISSDGQISGSFDADFFSSITSMAITMLSSGSMVILYSSEMYCSKSYSEFIPAGAGAWRAQKGNVQNTNSLDI